MTLVKIVKINTLMKVTVVIAGIVLAGLIISCYSKKAVAEDMRNPLPENPPSASIHNTVKVAQALDTTPKPTPTGLKILATSKKTEDKVDKLTELNQGMLKLIKNQAESKATQSAKDKLIFQYLADYDKNQKAGNKQIVDSLHKYKKEAVANKQVVKQIEVADKANNTLSYIFIGIIVLSNLAAPYLKDFFDRYRIKKRASYV